VSDATGAVDDTTAKLLELIDIIIYVHKIKVSSIRSRLVQYELTLMAKRA